MNVNPRYTDVRRNARMLHTRSGMLMYMNEVNPTATINRLDMIIMATL